MKSCMHLLRSYVHNLCGKGTFCLFLTQIECEGVFFMLISLRIICVCFLFLTQKSNMFSVSHTEKCMFSVSLIHS